MEKKSATLFGGYLEDMEIFFYIPPFFPKKILKKGENFGIF